MTWHWEPAALGKKNVWLERERERAAGGGCRRWFDALFWEEVFTFSSTSPGCFLSSPASDQQQQQHTWTAELRRQVKVGRISVSVTVCEVDTDWAEEVEAFRRFKASFFNICKFWCNVCSELRFRLLADAALKRLKGFLHHAVSDLSDFLHSLEHVGTDKLFNHNYFPSFSSDSDAYGAENR